MRTQPIADLGQALADLQGVVELLLVARGPPGRVLQILLPPGRVDAGGLDVPAVVRRDPDVLPRRRDDQALDPIEGLVIAHRLAVRATVAKSLAGAPPADARFAEVTAPQSHGASF
jgi:hypothetical protein